MKWSKYYIRTLREVPGEAELQSHILLLRAGMISKLVSGVYSFTPLGLRVLKKIEDIVRVEMDNAGAIEVRMSSLQPKELWEQTDRWGDFGPEMFRLSDRHEREFCLGPTHEEIFANLAKEEIDSYRQLPLNLYQIGNKYRDEKRPRFGLLRSREFIMKDAYSFHTDFESLNEEYVNMSEAYKKIFDRLKIDYKIVSAFTGAMGGSGSDEFIALTDAGESEIIYCSSCDYAATRERAEIGKGTAVEEKEKPIEEVHTPNAKTIDDVSNQINLPKEKTIKALILKDELNDKTILAFIRGNRELNISKLASAIKTQEYAIDFLNETEIKIDGVVPGFTGPTNVKKSDDVIIISDSELKDLKNLCAGAGKKDYHLLNVNYGRDWTADILADISLAEEGDICPVCGAKLLKKRGIEVGQVFKLGDKYSKGLNANYQTESGDEKPIIMGSYGVGITRSMQAVVEQKNDDNGIIWPKNIAPFQVDVIIANIKDETQVKLAEEIYAKLREKNIEVILDDRDERPGVKFKDADLIGFPYRITIGKKAGEGLVEFKKREDKDFDLLKSEEVFNKF